MALFPPWPPFIHPKLTRAIEFSLRTFDGYEHCFSRLNITPQRSYHFLNAHCHVTMVQTLPDAATTLRGGCGCGAVRYTMRIPDLASRPIFLKAGDSKGQGDLRYPLMLVCHCNDCRRATGSLTSPATMCPVIYITFSLLKRPVDGHDVGVIAEGKVQRLDVDAANAVKQTDATRQTYLQHYQSPTQKPVNRTFCGRCGTPTGNCYYPLPGPFLPSFDILLGTLDRDDLEKVRPDRHFWWESGVGWVQRWFTQGDTSLGGDLKGIPCHPTIHLNEFTEGYADGS